MAGRLFHSSSAPSSPILGVNIKPDNQSKANGKIRPSVIGESAVQKVGVVGAVTTETPDISSPGPNIKIEDDVANITAGDEVKSLTDPGDRQDHRAHPHRLSA